MHIEGSYRTRLAQLLISCALCGVVAGTSGCPDLSDTAGSDGQIDPDENAGRRLAVVMASERTVVDEGTSELRFVPTHDGVVYVHDLDDGVTLMRLAVRSGERIVLRPARGQLDLDGTAVIAPGMVRGHAHQLVFADEYSVDRSERSLRDRQRGMSRYEIENDLAQLAAEQAEEQRRQSSLSASWPGRNDPPRQDAPPRRDNPPRSDPPRDDPRRPQGPVAPTRDARSVPKSAQILVKEAESRAEFRPSGPGEIIVWDREAQRIVASSIVNGGEACQVANGRLMINRRPAGENFSARQLRIYFVPRGS